MFSKSKYDGVGKQVKSFLSFDVDESFYNYNAAKDVNGDTVVEQSESVYDKAGNEIFSISYERNFDTVDEGELDESLGRPDFSATWYDVLGRIDTGAHYGQDVEDNFPDTRPSANPPETNGDVRVTKNVYGATLASISGSNYRWSYTVQTDGSISGNEINSIGNTVRSWTKSGEVGSNLFRLSQFEHDPLGVGGTKK